MKNGRNRRIKKSSHSVVDEGYENSPGNISPRKGQVWPSSDALNDLRTGEISVLFQVGHKIAVVWNPTWIRTLFKSVLNFILSDNRR